MLNIIILILSIVLVSEVSMASGYQYEVQRAGNHIAHIVTINPKNYKIEIVKSNNGRSGRETVSSIAGRSNAEIAINGGFFEIGNNKDGAASGTLIIDGYVYNVKNKRQAIIIIENNKLSITRDNPQNYVSKKISIVSGIPLLLNEGNINPDIFLEKVSGYYIKAHARTAVGVKSDGTIVLAVIEHPYIRDLLSITLGEVESFMNTKGELWAKKLNKNPKDITITELKEILREEFTPANNIQGLTILELAKLMKDIGCNDAINLDGGGSSTLYIKGKVINQVIGDSDEAEGAQVLRPVSDAIIFKKK